MNGLSTNMHDKTDLELIALAQTGDVAARNAMITRHHGLVVSVCMRAVKTSDHEQYQSEAVQAFMCAINKFDAARGFRFTTYVCTAMYRAVYRAMRVNQTIRGPQNWKQSDSAKQAAACCGKVISYDGGYALRSELSAPDPLECLHEAEELQGQLQRLRQCINRLPDRCQEAILLRLSGKTLEATGKRMKITRKRVRQIELTAKAMLRRMMMEPV